MVVLEEIEEPAVGVKGHGLRGEEEDDDGPPDIEEIPGSELSVPIKVGAGARRTHHDHPAS